MKKITVVSRQRSFKVQIENILSKNEFSVEHTTSLESLEKKIIKQKFDLVIISGESYKQDFIANKTRLEMISEAYPVVQIIFIVKEEDVKLAIETLKKGAFHYIKLPLNEEELKFLIRTAIDERPRITSGENISGNLRDRLGDLVGNSTPMQKVYEQIIQAAETDIPILILGETGTGKDLVAQSIHKLSKRSEKPYTPLNLGALPSELVASDLFGHEKGSFTGAINQHAGVFEQGSEGTVFLDEIDTIGEKVQVSLLRLLEQKKFKRLGGRKTITSKARLIVASNEDLEELVRLKSFRMDLFYRMDIFRIMLPSLKERNSDIPLLVNEMIARYNNTYKKNIKNIDSSCIEAFMLYDWPGNVRELKNIVQRAVLVCDSDKIELSHLPVRFRKSIGQVPEMKFEVGTKLEEIEREVILNTLAATNNNRLKTAEILGISRRALYNKIDRYKI